MNRDDFPILKQDLIYFDNGATTLKPQTMIDATTDYYSNYTANAHRGDYDNSLKVDILYEGTRGKVRALIDAPDASQIIFTKGTTESLNIIVFGYMRYYLKKGDEVLLTKAEHASNLLPWMELAKEIGIVLKYIPIDSHNEITISNVLKSITVNTKVISIAHVTNVMGDIRPVEEIGAICKEKKILFVVDGAQSVPHVVTSVIKMNADFFAFSAHKMLGPTGVGVLYGKKDLLEKIKPLNYGGGMNSYFESDGEVVYHDVPSLFDAGTPNIAGVIGFSAVIDYLMAIGIDKINNYILELRRYLVKELETIPNIIIYNKYNEGTTVAFNLEGVFSQDTAVYLNHYHICVRAGNHCAKILKDDLKVKNTCRISLYLYNTKEEIDKLITVLRDSKQIFNIVL
ncbi:MAG: cysteine desulfurase [Bacilli bacterium]